MTFDIAYLPNVISSPNLSTQLSNIFNQFERRYRRIYLFKILNGKNEIMAHGQIWCYINSKQCNIESNVSIIWT